MKSSRLRCTFGFAAMLWLFFVGVAHAHKPSDSYLTIAPAAESIRWDIAVRDLDFAIGLDADSDGTVTWGELRRQEAEISAYALARLKISVDAGACSPRFGHLLIDTHSDGTYAVLDLKSDCLRNARSIELDYALLFDLDAQHRSIVSLSNGSQTQVSVLSARSHRVTFDLAATGQVGFFEFVGDGIAHVLSGFDHMLFMAVLLLPVMLRRQNGEWRPRESICDAIVDTLKIVTMFTLAHATTLTLAILGLITVPSWIIETAIALSIAAAAADNILPLFGSRRWLLAFGFGFVHGAGFASAFEGLSLPPWPLASALAGLNIGVEIAQLLVAAVVTPVALIAWRRLSYRDIVVPLGSAAASVVALAWAAERVFGLILVS
jgi:hypothetical protein